MVCAGCSLEEVQKAHPGLHDLYQLSHTKGQVVIEVKSASDPEVWSYFAWPPHIWVRAEDGLFEQLAAEKNLFKEVEITGLLRDTRDLDMFSITFKG